MVGCPSAPKTWATVSGRHRIGFSSPCSTISHSWKTSSTPTYLMATCSGRKNLGDHSPTRMQRIQADEPGSIYRRLTSSHSGTVYGFSNSPSFHPRTWCMLLSKQSLTRLDLVGRDHPAWLVWKETRVCQATNCLPGCTEILFIIYVILSPYNILIFFVLLFYYYFLSGVSEEFTAGPRLRCAPSGPGSQGGGRLFFCFYFGWPLPLLVLLVLLGLLVLLVLSFVFPFLLLNSCSCGHSSGNQSVLNS